MARLGTCRLAVCSVMPTSWLQGTCAALRRPGPPPRQTPVLVPSGRTARPWHNSETGGRAKYAGIYGASMSPDATAFAHLVHDRGSPRRRSVSCSVWRASSSRDVELPVVGPVTRVMHSADGHWLACQVAPEGGTRSQIWVVTTDPDDRAARRIDSWPFRGGGRHRGAHRLGRLPGGGDPHRRGRSGQLVSARPRKPAPVTVLHPPAFGRPARRLLVRGRRWCGWVHGVTAT